MVWADERGRAIHLEGAPVFLRACVLGQLQYSRLVRPLFPIAVDEELLFDRVCMYVWCVAYWYSVLLNARQ